MHTNGCITTISILGSHCQYKGLNSKEILSVWWLFSKQGHTIYDGEDRQHTIKCQNDIKILLAYVVGLHVLLCYFWYASWYCSLVTLMLVVKIAGREPRPAAFLTPVITLKQTAQALCMLLEVFEKTWVRCSTERLSWASQMSTSLARLSLNSAVETEFTRPFWYVVPPDELIFNFLWNVQVLQFVTEVLLEVEKATKGYSK